MRRGCLTAVLLAIPTLFFGIAGAWTYVNLARLDSGVTTVGRVVDKIQVDSSDGPTYRPVVEFADEQGRVYRFERGFSVGGSAVPELGEERRILYDPANPADAAVVGVLFWLGPVLFGLAGVIGLAIALIIRLVIRRSTDRPAPPPGMGIGQEGDVEFRRVESDFSADGELRYRVVAIDPSGQEYRSKWFDEDPTVEIVTQRPALRIDSRGSVDW
jgi:hypothetical protein